MRKFILLIFLITFSLNAFAQKKLSEKATKITNEFTEVLSLNKEEKTKVYEIQLKRFKDVGSIREKYKDDSETRKSELKKVFNKLFGKLKATLGEEKMKQWNDYKREIGR